MPMLNCIQRAERRRIAEERKKEADRLAGKKSHHPLVSDPLKKRVKSGYKRGRFFWEVEGAN